MTYGYIYIVENLLNGKAYVGQTIDLSKRRSKHFSGQSACPALRGAIRKYGSESFDFVLLERCFSQEELNVREQSWIKELNSLSPFGYNLKEGGEQGGSPSIETREKISQSLLGFKHTEEFKRKRSLAYRGKGHPLYGKPCSEETKSKLREAQLGPKGWFYGKTHSEEVRDKIRASKIGEKNPNFGKSYSKEEREQRSRKMKEFWRKRRENNGGT